MLHPVGVILQLITRGNIDSQIIRLAERKEQNYPSVCWIEVLALGIHLQHTTEY